MLTETKITLTVAAAGSNSALVVSINELLKFYFFGSPTEEVVEITENQIFKSVKTSRTRTQTVSPTKSSNFDLRKSNNPNTVIGDRYYKRHKGYFINHLQKYVNSLVAWESTNREWWIEAYEQRKYIIQNQNFNPYVQITGGYDSENYWWAKNLHMNQFCENAYSSRTYFQKHKDQFWLMCTIDGKNPENDDSFGISNATKANFKKGAELEESITYLTLNQAKKTGIINKEIKNKDNFVVYDYSPEWWNWSYTYRFLADKADEKSEFPLSSRFLKASSGWNSELNATTALNVICKDFYEQNDTTSQDEIDDAWRYCSDIGKSSQ
ncbi:hypothetical protein MHSWG343_06030 [Candidatus Mycoplasma haematohominis]|uniref:Uncharacterized protein n=1 Tax=Candidatus Mycoplasma haematohominis TaxID=1494318 RepID=A0A478FT89_9MOLU|nr:hypothetical protein MHSWG343_06030 [Candidatus Mycoplasma haemohominis]